MQGIPVEVKDRILEASEELFLKYGVKSITMDEIARHLSISKKTIYQYFQDKDEIVYLVIKNHFERNEELMCDAFASSVNAIDEMMQVSNHMRKTVVNIHQSLLFDLQKHHPQAWKILLNHKRHFILKQITNNLERGVREGLYRPGIRIDILARLRIEQVQLAFDNQVFPADQFHFIEVQMQILDHFLRGIITGEGLQLLNQYHQQTDTQLIK